MWSSEKKGDHKATWFSLCKDVFACDQKIWRDTLWSVTRGSHLGVGIQRVSLFFLSVFLYDPHCTYIFCGCLVAKSRPTLLRPHGLQCTRPPCPSPPPRVHPNSCPSSWWCHPTISSSVLPFFSHPQSFPASGSFPTSQLFTLGGQRIGVSASTSVLPMSIKGWFPSGWTGWISL